MSSTPCDTPDGEPNPVVEAIRTVESDRRLTVLAALQVDGQQFDELQQTTEVPTETLETVLADLEELGLVDGGLGDTLVTADYRCSQEMTGASCEPDGPDTSTHYSLTPKGEALAPVFEELGSWAAEWE